jgi:hypothetical protein
LLWVAPGRNVDLNFVCEENQPKIWNQSHWLPSQRRRPFVTSPSRSCCQDTSSSHGLFPLAQVFLLLLESSWMSLLPSVSSPPVSPQSALTNGLKIQSLGSQSVYWLLSRCPNQT